MTRDVIKSLSRPTRYFGIEGRYLYLTGILVLLSLFFSIIIGAFSSMIIGFAAFLILFMVSVIVTKNIQRKIPERLIMKTMSRRNYPQRYRMESRVVRNTYKGINR